MSNSSYADPAEFRGYLDDDAALKLNDLTPQDEIVIEVKAINYLDTSARPALAYFSVSFAHYPILSVVMHLLNVASLVLFVYYLVTDHAIIHPLVLLWGIAGFGGMTIVLWKAATEIERPKQ